MKMKIVSVIFLLICVLVCEAADSSERDGRNGWMATIISRFKIGKGDGQMSQCGAALISQHWLLTAAHCVQRGTEVAYRIRVNLGIRGRNTNERFQRQVITNPAILVHPLFYETADGAFNNDFALINLPIPVPDNSEIYKPIALPDKSFCSANKYNWRTTVELDGCADFLHSVRVKNFGQTNESFPDSVVAFNSFLRCERANLGQFSISKICTFGFDACPPFVTSGTPLVCRGSNITQTDAYYLIGVSSYGAGDNETTCETDDSSQNSTLHAAKPRVYSRICRALNWLTRVIKQNDVGTVRNVKAAAVVAEETQVCRQTPSIPNGLVEEGSSLHGSWRNIYCNDGYFLEGDDTIQCMSSGEWDIKAKCMAKTSNDNSLLPNGKGAENSETLPVAMWMWIAIAFTVLSLLLLTSYGLIQGCIEH